MTFSTLVWTRDALIEQCADHTYVYGRWDRLFGSWRRIGEGQIAKAFTPLWPLLDKFGRLAIAKANTALADEYDEDDEWFLQQFGYYDAVELETWATGGFGIADPAITDHAEARHLFQRYADLIPLETRRVAGAFGTWQWIVLSMIRDTPTFQDFLRQELSVSGPGFVAACLALAGADQLNDPERSQLCRDLIFEKRSILVARIAGEHHQRAAARWLHKLEADACSMKQCAELLALVRDPIKAQVASHMPRLTFPILWWLLRLPSWVCSVKLVECLAELATDTKSRRLDDLFTLCRRGELKHPDQRRYIARALRRAKSSEHLLVVLDSLTTHLLSMVPFPPAPFPGDERLQPLTSVRTMRAEGRRMRNCVGQLVREVLDGSHYFYRWEGSELAIVSLTRGASDSWELGECAGRCNESLTPTTTAQIKAAVRKMLLSGPSRERCTA
jgi:hypothetical protein